MRTFKSRRGRWAVYNASPGAHQCRQVKREAVSIAGQAPEYPSAAPLHGDWLGGRINGHTVILRLMRDSAHRSDQWAAEVDGKVVAQAAGLTALWSLLRERFPRAPSRREIANYQVGHTARDERDAARALDF